MNHPEETTDTITKNAPKILRGEVSFPEEDAKYY